MVYQLECLQLMRHLMLSNFNGGSLITISSCMVGYPFTMAVGIKLY